LILLCEIKVNNIFFWLPLLDKSNKVKLFLKKTCGPQKYEKEEKVKLDESRNFQLE
jgi:hypothetical protein